MQIDPEMQRWNRQLEKLPKIVAVDFDGYLTVRGTMKPNKRHVRKVKRLYRSGWQVILWTCRVGKHADEALEWCHRYGIFPHTVNRNIEAVIQITGYDSRKVHADIYLDDKNRY